MPLRVTDSIFQQDTGRFIHEVDIDFLISRSVDFGKLGPKITAHSNWVTECLNFLIIWNEKLPRPFDPWFMLFQIWHETNGFISPYIINDGNLAGIGIWASGIPSPWSGKLSPEVAAKVYLLELMVHTYNLAEFEQWLATEGGAFIGAFERDRPHLEKVLALRRSVNWPTVRFINQLNDPVGKWDFIWAADPQYPEKIARTANEVASNIPDTKGGTMAVNIGNRPLRIAIGAGHRNTNGGNTFETALNAKCTNEIVKLCRKSSGFEIRSYTPEDGLGFFNGELDDAAAIPRKWLAEGWAADILHEVHHEGTAPSIRGGFFIYPDSEGLIGRNAGNIDIDVREAAGEMTKRLIYPFDGVSRYTPPRGMSEKETQVGGNGFRLGVFGAWAEPYFNANSFQFISEAATYTNTADLAIMQRPDYPAKHALGMLQAYAYLAKTRGQWTFPYTVGSTPNVPATPVVNPGPDGLAYPAGLDNAMMALIFGQVIDGGKVYRFSPTGGISRKWYTRFKAEQNWPRLLWHFLDKSSGREMYGFYNGEILYRPGSGKGWVWK